VVCVCVCVCVCACVCVCVRERGEVRAVERKKAGGEEVATSKTAPCPPLLLSPSLSSYLWPLDAPGRVKAVRLDLGALQDAALELPVGQVGGGVEGDGLGEPVGGLWRVCVDGKEVRERERPGVRGGGGGEEKRCTPLMAGG